MVKVLPEPVTPSSVWKLSPSLTPSTRPWIAAGWSPAGGYGWKSWNGEPSKETNSPFGASDVAASAAAAADVSACVAADFAPLAAGV